MRPRPPAGTALFERRPWSYIFINGGYWVVSLVVMGTIIGSTHKRMFMGVRIAPTRNE